MWFVCSEDGKGGFLLHHRGQSFDTKDEAINLAEYLAGSYPGREYFVLKNTHVVKFEGVTITEVGD